MNQLQHWRATLQSTRDRFGSSRGLFGTGERHRRIGGRPARGGDECQELGSHAVQQRGHGATLYLIRNARFGPWSAARKGEATRHSL